MNLTAADLALAIARLAATRMSPNGIWSHHGSSNELYVPVPSPGPVPREEGL